MLCSSMAHATYADYFAPLRNKIIERRLPISGVLEPTFRCNLRCAHCYCSHDTLKEEMTYADICRILDELADMGCLWLLITGGEPILRPDFPEIYVYAKRKGMIITLFTNGTLIDDSIADLLSEYPPSSIEITLYGATKGIYEKVTGVRGSFERCMAGIEHLLDRKLPLDLKTVVMTLNKDEFRQMKEFAKDKGVDFRFDYSINPALDGSRGPCQFRISPEDAVALDLADVEKAQAWREYFKARGSNEESDLLYTCGAGRTSFNIDPFGKLSLCALAREDAYDLRGGSFKEGWNEHIPKVISTKRKHESKCQACDIQALCDLCPGWSILEAGKAEAHVEYLCRMADLRAKAFRLGRYCNENKEEEHEKNLCKA